MSSSDSWTLVGLTILVVLLLFYLSKKMICALSPSGSSPGGNGRRPYDNPEYLQQERQNYRSEQEDYYYENDILARVITSNGFGPVIGSFDNSLDTLDNGGGGGGHHVLRCHQQDGLDNRNSNSLIDPIQVSIISSSSSQPPSFTITPVFPVNSVGSSRLYTVRPALTMARKNMIESKLRTEILRMVAAEREVQRLANLLSIEQGLGLNGEEYITTFRNNLLHPSRHHQYQGSSASETITNAFCSSTNTSTTTTTTGSDACNTNGTSTTPRELILSTGTLLLHAQEPDHIPSHQEEEEGLDLDLDLDQPPPPYDECVPR